MTQHTPCGCRVKSVQFSLGNPNGQFEVVYCPTHALAPEMAEALRRLIHAIEVRKRHPRNILGAMVQARALLARLEG